MSFIQSEEFNPVWPFSQIETNPASNLLDQQNIQIAATSKTNDSHQKKAKGHCEI